MSGGLKDKGVFDLLSQEIYRQRGPIYNSAIDKYYCNPGCSRYHIDSEDGFAYCDHPLVEFVNLSLCALDRSGRLECRAFNPSNVEAILLGRAPEDNCGHGCPVTDCERSIPVRHEHKCKIEGCEGGLCGKDLYITPGAATEEEIRKGIEVLSSCKRESPKNGDEGQSSPQGAKERGENLKAVLEVEIDNCIKYIKDYGTNTSSDTYGINISCKRIALAQLIMAWAELNKVK